MLLDKIYKRLEEKENKMIDIRRHLHENPELSFQETKTASYIENFYKGKDCVVRSNVGGIKGITVDIKGSKPGKCIAIRADFDALPIEEETGLPFSSKNKGVMHACGHDAHTAYMLVLAETLIEFKEELSGTVRVIHQPAEEVPPGGAISMVEDGVLNGVDAVLGIHVMSTMKTGEVFYKSGKVHTGRATFKVTIKGKGGHGSMPHLANDTIVGAANFVTSVQTIISRRINPFDSAVVTIGSFDGKGSANVIKETVFLEGDVRIMNEDCRSIIEEEFSRLLRGTCEAYDLSYTLDYKNDYPVLENDYEVTKLVAEALKEANISEVSSVAECEAQTPSEDFAYYARQKPSCFFYVGAHKEGTTMYPHHNPKFDIDEKSLLISAKSMATGLLKCLKEDN
ncbi:amidohydrolase [Gemella sp. GH3]|uniref:M20 family metallopeptidase n=1 Tax=unclassified Gemella TaxID=2624949 RepID=UPI0015CF9AB2|nr:MULTISPECIES: M20 family metallopeptidase [unclassified Gemella]MBF0713630.1 amidohydrolase [Gemella sp. GH3.1]NYS50582.1 amidohydrolase [Gemella sp. GH3]